MVKSPPLSVDWEKMLAVLRRRPGVLHSHADVLRGLGEDPDDSDNVAAVIWAGCRMEDHGKLKSGKIPGALPHLEDGWMVPKPKDALEARPGRA